MTAYRLTRQQLDRALTQAIEMFIELFDDRDPESCKYAAVSEIMQGIDADRELVANDPTERLRLQLPDNENVLRAALEAVDNPLLNLLSYAEDWEMPSQKTWAEAAEAYKILEAALRPKLPRKGAER